MAKFIFGILIGLVVGGVITFYTFVGVPRASQTPGQPIQAPEPGQPAGTAQIVLRQDLFNEVLTTIFDQMKSPTFQLAGAAGSRMISRYCKTLHFKSNPDAAARSLYLRKAAACRPE